VDDDLESSRRERRLRKMLDDVDNSRTSLDSLEGPALRWGVEEIDRLRVEVATLKGSKKYEPTQEQYEHEPLCYAAASAGYTETQVIELLIRNLQETRDRLVLEAPGAALLVAYPHMYAVEFGDRLGLRRIKVTPNSRDGWDAGWRNHPTLDEALRDAEERAAKATGRTEE
jgi:hypothetical protein